MQGKTEAKEETEVYAGQVGDNAIGINKRLMNPFFIRNMELVVENAFDILAHKFRVLLRTMNQMPETCRKVITTSQSHHTEISSHPHQPDGLGG